MSDPNNVLRGHKAALTNPNVSEEAKAHSQQEIERLEAELGVQTGTVDDTVHEHRVAGGYKATLANPNTSDEAKAKAQAVLNDMGVETYGSTGAPVANDQRIEEDAAQDTEHRNRQLGGYKATLANDNTSDEAKANAEEKLRHAGAL